MAQLFLFVFCCRFLGDRVFIDIDLTVDTFAVLNVGTDKFQHMVIEVTFLAIRNAEKLTVQGFVHADFKGDFIFLCHDLLCLSLVFCLVMSYGDGRWAVSVLRASQNLWGGGRRSCVSQPIG